jgi:hypothetical protein
MGVAVLIKLNTLEISLKLSVADSDQERNTHLGLVTKPKMEDRSVQ